LHTKVMNLSMKRRQRLACTTLTWCLGYICNIINTSFREKPSDSVWLGYSHFWFRYQQEASCLLWLFQACVWLVELVLEYASIIVRGLGCFVLVVFCFGLAVLLLLCFRPSATIFLGYKAHVLALVWVDLVGCLY